MAVDVRAEHYDASDRVLLITAGNALIGWARDLAFHESDGEGWNRSVDDDPVITAGQLGWLLCVTHRVLAEADEWYADATGAARDRAEQPWTRP